MLKDHKIEEYLDVLGSNAPAPGGGSASALCGAQGAALVAMVASLTLGKKKYAEHEALCAEVLDDAQQLKSKLQAQIDLDTEAFNLVSAAFKLPKDSEEEKKARADAIADATLQAARVPFDTMRLANETVTLAQSLINKSNTNAASDLGVAALNLLGCARGAWLNVLINLGGIASGGEKLKEDGQKLMAEIEQRCEQVYQTILQMVG